MVIRRMRMNVTLQMNFDLHLSWGQESVVSVSALHLSRTKLCQASKYLSSALFLQFVYQGVGGHVHWIQLKFLAILEFSPRTDGWQLFPSERNFDIYHFLGRLFWPENLLRGLTFLNILAVWCFIFLGPHTHHDYLPPSPKILFLCLWIPFAFCRIYIPAPGPVRSG